MRTPAELLDQIGQWPDTCDSGVTRDGEYVPCDKPTVGVRINDDDELAAAGEYAWPVCAYHVLKGHMIPLRDLLAWQGRIRYPIHAPDQSSSVSRVQAGGHA